MGNTPKWGDNLKEKQQTKPPKNNKRKQKTTKTKTKQYKNTINN